MIDFLIMTPPCNPFSVASIGHHWTGGKKAYLPKTAEAKTAINLVMNLLDLDSYFGPKYTVLENPRGVLRKLFPGWLQGTVWLCQYGDPRAKPTDFFGRIPPAFEFKTCHNGAKDHESAPRGAKTGTQGIDGADMRAKMPFALSKALLDSFLESQGEVA